MRTNPDSDVDVSGGMTTASTGFLRRFADMMSGGPNAAKMKQAADLIERLDRQLAEAELRAGHAEKKSDTYRNLSLAADDTVRDLQSRITELQEHVEALEQEKAALLAKACDEEQRLNAIIAEAVLGHETVSRELASRNAQLDALAGCAVVSKATMSAILNQFNSIADECDVTGNLVLATMCDIGRHLAEQAGATAPMADPMADVIHTT